MTMLDLLPKWVIIKQVILFSFIGIITYYLSEIYVTDREKENDTNIRKINHNMSFEQIEKIMGEPDYYHVFYSSNGEINVILFYKSSKGWIPVTSDYNVRFTISKSTKVSEIDYTGE